MTRALAFLISYPLAGALFVGGGLVALHYFGEKPSRNLGRAAGYSFAEGMAALQAAKAAVESHLPTHPAVS